MKVLKSYIFLLIAIGFFCGLISCKEDNLELKDTRLSLTANLLTPQNISTRGELTVRNITNSEFNIPFYVEMECDGKTNFGVYEVKEGMEAQLSSKNTSTSLNWFSPTDNHTFYSWTMPWTADTYTPKENPQTKISFNQYDAMYEGLGHNRNNNCRILETFIGAKTGPVNYRDNGEYVELQYQHLVSKIRVNSLLLIKSDGTTDKSVTGTMTFLGMPQTATFNRRPEDGGAPIVIANDGSSDPKDVTYNLGNTSVFYVCPNVDYSTLEFKIHLNDGKSDEGDYYGNFSNVRFNREEHTGWDEGKSEKVLYAGEIMNLNITLTQGHGVGVTTTIIGWDVESTKTGSSYSHPGIYSSSQAQTVSDTFSKNPPSDEEIDEIFGLYGDVINGNKEFPVYEDIQLNQGSFNLGKEYTLNGMGHTLTMTPNSSTPHKVRVGNCRDIYITDGEFTVYIDANGFIYTVNEDGSLKETGNQLPPLTVTGSKNNYQIDLTNGTYI